MSLRLSSVILVLSLAATLHAEEKRPGIFSRLFAKKDAPSSPAPQIPPAPSIPHRSYFSDPKLLALIDSALKSNFDLKIALQRIEASRANLIAARGALRPTVDGVAGYSRRKFGDYTMDGAGNSGTPIYRSEGLTVPRDLPDYLIGFQATWELDLWGKLRSQRDAAATRLLASDEARRWVQTTLIADLATAYYELVALDAQLTTLADTKRIQNEALEALKAQKQAGAANQLAVEQFQAQLLDLDSQKLEVQQTIVETEGSISMLLGEQRRNIPRSSDLATASLPSLASKVPATYLANRPDIRAAELEVAASKADVAAAKAQFYPSLSLTGLLGLQAFRPELILNSHSATYNAAGSLIAPLINRAAIKAQFKEASATQLEALYSYQQSLVNGYVEVNNQLSLLRLLEQARALKKQQVELLTTSISTASDLFKNGRATYLESLTAQQAALDARLGLLDVKKRQLQTSVALYKALGGGA
jgi:NodT family efflux transporter outer membrane factor (OMF) lipoprotein